MEEKVKITRTQLPRYFGHVALAALLGPYIFAVGFGFLEFWVESEIRPTSVFLDYPSQMLVFGFPFVLLFAVLSFFPLQAVLRIRNPASQRTAFILTGGALGLVVGGVFAWLVPGALNSAYMVVIGVVVGLLCGVLDWLVWRPRGLVSS